MREGARVNFFTKINKINNISTEQHTVSVLSGKITQRTHWAKGRASHPTPDPHSCGHSEQHPNQWPGLAPNHEWPTGDNPALLSVNNSGFFSVFPKIDKVLQENIRREEMRLQVEMKKM